MGWKFPCRGFVTCCAVLADGGVIYLKPPLQTKYRYYPTVQYLCTAGGKSKAEANADSHDGGEDGPDEDFGQRPRAVKVQGAVGQVQVTTIGHRTETHAPQRLCRVRASTT